jgi:hypothetical protein
VGIVILYHSPNKEPKFLGDFIEKEFADDHDFVQKTTMYKSLDIKESFVKVKINARYCAHPILSHFVLFELVEL